MMSTSETYDDANDGSTLRVFAPGFDRNLLRFTGNDTVDQTDVDLNREGVKALVAQATKWLEDTEVKLPTTVGSVVHADNPDPAWAMLQTDGLWHAKHGVVDPALWADGFVVEHDAGNA